MKAQGNFIQDILSKSHRAQAMPLPSTRRWTYSLTVAALALVLAAGAWLLRGSPVPAAGVRQIILISIDTCRADYLGCYGYQSETTPNIDAVAAEGILFENAISPVPVTLPAHSSMLTGTDPPYHGVHDNSAHLVDDSNVALAETLKNVGFTTGAAVSAFVLDAQFGLGQGFDTYHDDFETPRVGNTVVQRRAGETTRVALEWLEENKNEEFFLFLHYYDPHHKYQPPEPFASQFASNPYAGEIAYTDHCIGQVIQKLKDLKLYASTLLIITADHGEMLGEHGEARLNRTILRLTTTAAGRSQVQAATSKPFEISARRLTWTPDFLVPTTTGESRITKLAGTTWPFVISTRPSSYVPIMRRPTTIEGPLMTRRATTTRPYKTMTRPSRSIPRTLIATAIGVLPM